MCKYVEEEGTSASAAAVVAAYVTLMATVPGWWIHTVNGNQFGDVNFMNKEHESITSFSVCFRLDPVTRQLIRFQPFTVTSVTTDK